MAGVLLNLALLVAGSLGAWRWRASEYRAGPWPGLTAIGAGMLLAWAAVLAGLVGLVGDPRQAWPDLVLLAATTLAPLAMATRLMRVPGAASAACGAYLLPRSLISLVQPSLEPPPLLLIPSVAFELLVWGRRSDVAAVWRLIPRRRGRQVRISRRVGAWRAAIGGGAYGAVLAAVVPPWASLLGRPDWSAGETVVAGVVSAAACAALSLLAAGAPGRGSQPTPVPTA